MQLPHNPYHGLNAHSMSYLVHVEGYHSFHTNYVSVLTFELNRTLPRRYRARTEDVLNILEIHPDMVEDKVRYPDVLVRTQGNMATSAGALATATLTVPLPSRSEAYIEKSVVIYDMQEAPKAKAVTVIELLSPTNKTHARADYDYKRYQITQLGVNLVELDWLHQFRSLIPGVPDYPLMRQSTPYYIAISAPQLQAQTLIYQFSVDDPIPTLPLPLAERETVTVDLNEVYNTAFEGGRLGDDVDYMQLPAHFAAYSPVDQERIQAVMARVAAEG